VIYTPENTGRGTKVLCGDTGNYLKSVFEINTKEHSVKMYNTPLSINPKTNETFWSEFKYSSIKTGYNSSGDYKFVLHGLKENQDAPT